MDTPLLSHPAAAILEQMSPGRCYEPAELSALAPDLNREALRDVMHELWIAHEVERAGDAGWRRRANHAAPGAPRHPSGNDGAALRVGRVKPEDLFNHKAFAGWFKQADE